MKIAAIVSRKGRQFTAVAGSAPLSQAVEVMHRAAIGSVGVVQHATPDTPGEVLGIVSQQELMTAIAEYGAAALEVPVSAVMRKPPMYCQCEDDASEVMYRMTHERCRHAVVRTVGGVVAGVVSLGDLVAALLSEAQLETGVLRDMARSRLMALPG